MLVPYMPDYFDKELLQLKLILTDDLRVALTQGANIIDHSGIILPAGLCYGANGTIVSTTLGATSTNTMLNRNNNSAAITNYPKLKCDKFKSVNQLVTSVGNIRFIENICRVVSDVVHRMECIGKDDKRLEDAIKDIAIFQVFYIIDGLIIPMERCCTALVLKQNSILNNSNAMNTVVGRSTAVDIPSTDVLLVLTTVYSGITTIKLNFINVFMKRLKSLPNAIAVYKEHRRKLLRVVENYGKECLFAWTLGVVACMEKLLSNMNKQYYSITSKSDTNTTTSTCVQVCKAISLVITKMLEHQKDMPGLNTIQLFWKPLGQEIMGTLISFLRKQKITPEGGEVLLRDVNAYCEVRMCYLNIFIYSYIYIYMDYYDIIFYVYMYI